MPHLPVDLWILASPLRISVTPAFGESLVGFIARAADANFVTLAALKTIIGLSWNFRELPNARHGARVAAALALDPALMPAPASTPNHHRRQVLGFEFPRDWVTHPGRKVCPGCLREHAYHRAVWDLAPVTACPAHACQLVGKCDGCGEALSWMGTAPSRCACGRDLSRMAAVPIAAADLGGTRIAYALLGVGDPGDVPERTRRSVQALGAQTVLSRAFRHVIDAHGPLVALTGVLPSIGLLALRRGFELQGPP